MSEAKLRRACPSCGGLWVTHTYSKLQVCYEVAQGNRLVLVLIGALAGGLLVGLLLAAMP